MVSPMSILWNLLAYAGGFYVGLTDDLAARLIKHNEGGVPHTAKIKAVAHQNRDCFLRTRSQSRRTFEIIPQIGFGTGFCEKRL